MTPIEKAKWLADFYAQAASGKTIQFRSNNPNNDWRDIRFDGPARGSDLSNWRIKPEPRRMWMGARGATYEEEEAAKWKAEGLKVTEWLEVV